MNANVVQLLALSVGDVIRLDYLQPVAGGPRRVGRVTEIRDTYDSPVTSRHYRRYDPSFRRSRNLITVLDTRGHFRKFYVERAENIKKPLFGRLRFAIASWFNKCRRNYFQLNPVGHD